ncbi:MAG: lipoyl(octanoyl) transferase LipB [Chloroflexi bacterium]|nr:lipoyl(octanoyl) transferase LipB [Chloroflexota bacterium]
MNPVPLAATWLGRVPYLAALEVQRALAARRAAGEARDTLLLLEHPPVFTFGRSGHVENLLIDLQECRRRGIEVHWLDRGGDVTYHGPGQLVGYPILALGALDSAGRLPRADYVAYVRRLEAALIDTLAHFGIVAAQRRGLTGVWVQPDVASRCPFCPPAKRLAPAKIAAIGVKVSAAAVSQHGFALNVAPQMEDWDLIMGCGLQGSPSASMEELLGSSVPSLEQVAEGSAASFACAFDRELDWVPASRVLASAAAPQAAPQARAHLAPQGRPHAQG